MFPYTSGDLHLGHWWNFALADVHARYKRMQGFNVLFPPGFDAFGLPAEGAAIKSGTHPYTWTMDNIRRMERQWRTMGGAYDWSKEVATCLPEYYRWNQWLFLQFLKRGLAYRQKAPVNWCPNHGVLANEQVHNGRCWRCEAPVSKRDLEQWFFRITQYADDLLDFSEIDWPERIVSMQTNWIGRSEGVEFDLPVDGHAGPEDLGVHHARRHGLRHDLRRAGARASAGRAADHARAPGRGRGVRRALAPARPTSSACRPSAQKTGVPIGSFAINPANGERLPIWIADYVLAQYGTGAIMAVPASDERDWEFARKFDLPIRVVVRPPDAPDDITADQLPGNTAYVDAGRHGQLGPVQRPDQRGGLGAHRRLVRGARHRPPAGQLPHARLAGLAPALLGHADPGRLLPDATASCRCPTTSCRCGCRRTSSSRLADAEGNPLATSASFVNTTCPICGGPARRETDTMDTFMDSSWYFLRYTSPDYEHGAVRPGQGAATGCRSTSTWAAPSTRSCTCCTAASSRACCSDLGLVDFREPFKRLYNQGEVLGPDGKRMSKSHGNVVNPDEHVERSGADAVRGWLAFLGPWDQGGPINESALGAIQRPAARHLEPGARRPRPTQAQGRPTRTCGGRCTRRSRASARTSKASASTRWSRS